MHVIDRYISSSSSLWKAVPWLPRRPGRRGPGILELGDIKSGIWNLKIQEHNWSIYIYIYNLSKAMGVQAGFPCNSAWWRNQMVYLLPRITSRCRGGAMARTWPHGVQTRAVASYLYEGSPLTKNKIYKLTGFAFMPVMETIRQFVRTTAKQLVGNQDWHAILRDQLQLLKIM